ncbi:MAG TPA: hypothetical protein VFH46_20160 [Pyrinomonadaceae bacterium]|nr:hypothetical protein [Pyrinomonadaceae bacterium]
MLDIALLAGTAIGQILVPYIKDGAVKFVKTVAEKNGEAMGEYAGGLANKVWDKVKSVFSSEKDQAVLEQFEEEPEAAAPLVEAKLKKKLEADPGFAEEFAKLVQSTAPNGGTGAQIIGSSYVGLLDMRGANVTGGGTFTGGTFNFGAPPASVEGPGQRPMPQPKTRNESDQD